MFFASCTFLSIATGGMITNGAGWSSISSSEGSKKYN